MKITYGAGNYKAHFIANLLRYGKVFFLFQADEAQMLCKNYPFSFVKLNKLFQPLIIMSSVLLS